MADAFTHRNREFELFILICTVVHCHKGHCVNYAMVTGTLIVTI